MLSFNGHICLIFYPIKTLKFIGDYLLPILDFFNANNFFHV